MGRTGFLLVLLAVPYQADRLSAEDSRPRELAGYDALIRPEQRRHWAFQPVKRPAIPAVRGKSWVRNPIDAFVLSRLEQRGWQPATPASPPALLRRMYMDLLGLPPTSEEQARFSQPSVPGIWENLIDRLLARPEYGERWARHWLDLVRYAETNGYERDAIKPNVWRYRDYVIRSFCSDKPFDRFILEQLAGDELSDDDKDSRLATGFHRLGPWDDEPADFKEDRFDQLDDMVSTTALVFQGLTIGCARCHNHKFEPVTMHDYYRMVAIFNPLQRPQNGRMELDLPVAPEGEIAAAYRRTAVQLAGAIGMSIGTRNRPASLAAATALVSTWRTPLSELEHGYFMLEPQTAPPGTHLLIRGKPTRPGPEVQPGVPAVLVDTQPRFPPHNGRTSGRRLRLAQWLLSKDNPLTARVLVNRIWQYHFGEGLVRTPSDFGTAGDRPTHPELLDWLACWFVNDADWSIKKLHRLIMASSTYRMSKQWNSDYGSEDPQNRLLWRMHYRRLEVEAIRDSMLAASGRLNRKMFGPSMYPEVPKEALEGSSDPDKIWKPFDEVDASRRTVYTFIKRSMVVPLLEVLDLCDSTRSAARREVTTVAPQALSLFNGSFAMRQSRHLAQRLLREVGPDRGKQIARAFELTLCRAPSSTEQANLLSFLKHEADRQRLQRPEPSADEADQEALVQMCRVIFNLNEFVYTD